MANENLEKNIVNTFGKIKLVKNESETTVNTNSTARIKIIGVGGAGGNTINRLIESGCEGVKFYAMNTDIQALNASKSENKIRLGEKKTNGLGAGGLLEVGEAAAEESRTQIASVLENTDMVFVTAGLGGGTGTGAAPIIAQMAKELGILTVAVVTKPFSFEGRARMKNAEMGAEKLREIVDAILVIPNDNLLEIIDKNTAILEAFAFADDVLAKGVRGITDIITIPGVINIDFADMKSVIKSSGTILMGTSSASGADRAIKAANEAINSKLVETDLYNASNIIVNISGGEDLNLFEITNAMDIINERVKDNAKVYVGTVFDKKMHNELSITVIATGFEIPENSKKSELIKPEFSSINFFSELMKPKTEPEKTPPKFESKIDIPKFLQDSSKNKEEKNKE